MSSQPLSLSPQSGSPGLSTCLSVPGASLGSWGTGWTRNKVLRWTSVPWLCDG